MQWITLSISIASLFLSIINLWINRKTLDVTIENEIFKTEKLYTQDNQVISEGGHFVVFIKVVNPSPRDIAYFDLRIVDPDKNKLIPSYTQVTLEQIDEKVLYYGNDSINKARLNPPYSNYGIFKSNSFNRIDLAFNPDEKTEKILIIFKVAIKSLKRNKFSLHRRKFKHYTKILELPRR